MPHPMTNVLLDDGSLVRCADLAAGDRLLVGTVTAVERTRPASAFRIESTRGTTIVRGDALVLLDGVWSEASEVDIGDRLAWNEEVTGVDMVTAMGVRVRTDYSTELLVCEYLVLRPPA